MVGVLNKDNVPAAVPSCNNEGGTSGTFNTEIDTVNKKIEKLQSGDRNKQYLGLSN